MKLKNIKLKNFKSYGDTETVLDLGFEGVKLIVGPNGVGKTTFFDALIWCLYGETAVGVDEVINWKTQKNCKVELNFSQLGSDYSIIRYRKHEEQSNKLLLFKDGKNISFKNKTDTQAKIIDVIEITYQAMISSVILTSEQYSSFLRAKPSERLKMFESVLSLKDVNEYNKKLKKLRIPLLEKLEKNSSKFIEKKSSLETLAETIEAYSNSAKESLKKLKKEKESKQKEINEIEERINEYREIDADKELKNNERHEEAIRQNDVINKQIINEENRIKDITEETIIYNKLIQERDELLSINVAEEFYKIDTYEEVKEKNAKIQNAIEKINLSIDTSAVSLAGNIRKIRNDLEKKETELEFLLNNENRCPVCSHLIEEELSEKLISNKKREILNIKETIKTVSDELEKIKNKNLILSNKRDKLNSAFTVLPDESNYARDFLNNLNNRIDKNKIEIKSYEEKIKSNEIYNDEIKGRVAELKKELTDIKNEPKHHTIFLKDLKKKVAELELIAEEKRQSIIIINTKAKTMYDKEYVKNTNLKIQKAEASLKAIGDKLQKLKEEDMYFLALAQVFSNKDTGFKKFFINKMTTIFNDKINFYLPLFFEHNFNISFDKDLKETITRDGKEISFKAFSSGQKTRFELSITFAMFMMVKTLFSGEINILVFDEILDQNLDQKGFNSVVEILNNLGKNSSIFAVSHQDYYKEKFNHHIQIKQDENEFSYVFKEV